LGGINIVNSQKIHLQFEKLVQPEKHGKMPVFKCSCGSEILILPEIATMTIALKNHIIVHKELTGQDITEELLTRQIINKIAAFTI
jgi:hypothetical protein